jgi:hypothetical protein
LDYLGYRIGKGAVELSSEQLNKIERWPKINKYNNLRSFFGMANYIQNFFPQYVELTDELNQKLKLSEKISKYRSSKTKVE